jgi:hypothetical protein
VSWPTLLDYTRAFHLWWFRGKGWAPSGVAGTPLHPSSRIRFALVSWLPGCSDLPAAGPYCSPVTAHGHALSLSPSHSGRDSDHPCLCKLLLWTTSLSHHVAAPPADTSCPPPALSTLLSAGAPGCLLLPAGWPFCHACWSSCWQPHLLHSHWAAPLDQQL